MCLRPIHAGLAAWAALAMGCAARERSHDPPPDSLVVPARAIQPDDLVPRDEGTLTYDLFLGDAQTPTARMTRTRQVSHEHGSAFAIHEGDRRVEYLSTSPDGSLLLHASLERGDGSVALFDPPLIVCPPSLPAGDPFTAEAAMRVVSDRHPERQREKGRARRTITHVGLERITTPAGTFDAHRIEITFLADLAFADADTLTVQWIVPGVGLVQEERSRRVTILGVQGNPTVERLVLSAVE